MESVTSACREAFDTLDAIEHHEGGHPRKGTVDLIPIHPITEETRYLKIYIYRQSPIFSPITKSLF